MRVSAALYLSALFPLAANRNGARERGGGPGRQRDFKRAIETSCLFLCSVSLTRAAPPCPSLPLSILQLLPFHLFPPPSPSLPSSPPVFLGHLISVFIPFVWHRHRPSVMEWPLPPPLCPQALPATFPRKKGRPGRAGEVG